MFARSSGYASSVSSLLSRKEIKEEKDEEDSKLIAYLNDPDAEEDQQSSVPRSRKSSASSLRSLPVQLFKPAEEPIAKDGPSNHRHGSVVTTSTLTDELRNPSVTDL